MAGTEMINKRESDNVKWIECHALVEKYLRITHLLFDFR